MTLVVLTIVALTANPEIPLPDLKLESTVISRKPDNLPGLFNYSVPDESRIPTSFTQHEVHIVETDTRIPLGQEVDLPREEHFKDRGMDPETFTCEWVRPGEILSFSWKTHSVFGGRWVAQGLVVVQRVGSEWREVFRSYCDAYYRGGAAYGSYGSLHLVEASDRGGLTLQQTVCHRSYASEWHPLSEEIQSGEGTSYSSNECVETDWPCAIEEGKLVFGEGAVYLNLQEKAFPPEEVAECVAPIGRATPDRKSTLIENQREALIEMNPHLKGEQAWSGRVKTGSAPPYEADPTQIWFISGK